MQHTLASIFVLVLALGLAVAPPFLFWWWFPRRNGAKWAASAEALKLRLDPYAPEHRMSAFYTSPPSCLQPMRGRRGELEVECGVKVLANAGEGNNYATYVRVTLPRSLELGLYVRPVGLFGRAWTAVAGEWDVQLGDSELDPVYDISGDYDERVQALLTAPPVAEALRKYRSLGPHIADTYVWFERSGKRLSAKTLGEMIDAGVDLGRRLVEARNQLSAS